MSINQATSQGWRDADGGQARAYLQRFLQENAASLQGILCGYVARMGLATGENIPLVASEIFQDAVLETLAHPEHFHPHTQPRAWFLAIAVNILKRHRAKYAKRYRFEVLVSDLPQRNERESEHDLLDRLMNYRGMPGPEQGLIARESVQELLALVSAEDARLLDLALVQGWSAETLAPMLKITPGTARVRVHRALTRLRKAWQKAEQRKKGER